MPFHPSFVPPIENLPPDHRRRRPAPPGDPRLFRWWLLSVIVTAACAGASSSTRTSGDCPHAEGHRTSHLVLIEESASERDPAVRAERQTLMGQHARQAADCEAPFAVVVLTMGRADLVYDTLLDSNLGTEVARDLQVEELADAAMADVQVALSDHLSHPTEPRLGSDPGAAYRVLAEALERLDPGATIDALVLSDGVTTGTGPVDLNRPLDEAELDHLAELVAPAVDLDERVHVDWPGIGRTADPAPPPSPWVDVLRRLWLQVCEARRAASCTVTTIS
jgi:hypothetical protein